jgi:hypothetical protein
MQLPEVAPADRLEIQALYARQSHLIDSGDFAGWAGTFTSSGVFESATYNRVARGTEELVEFGRNSSADAVAQGHQIRHLVSTIDIVAASPTTASARAYLMFVYITADSATIERSLLVEDELVKESDGWRFTSRRTARDPQAGTPT